MAYNRLYLQKGDELSEEVFEHIENGIDANSSKILTQTEYDALETKNINTKYLIVENEELIKFYIGPFLIGQKEDNASYPYSFPIIF